MRCTGRPKRSREGYCIVYTSGKATAAPAAGASELSVRRYFAEYFDSKPALKAGHSGSMKVRKILKILRNDGWVQVASRGSHRQLKHPHKRGRVTVPGKPSDDLAAGTLNSILKQAGLKE